MIYNHLDIRRDVRLAMDENVAAQGIIRDNEIDTITLDDIIESKVADAVKAVEMQAPVYMLDSGRNFATNIFWGRGGMGWTILPDDFLRLILFKMSDWERGVYTAISEADAEYALARSRYRGIAGNPQRPVCAITLRAEGKVLEFYTSDSKEARVEHAVYLPTPRMMGGGIDICERCYRPVVYYVAGLACQAVGDTEAATGHFEISKSLIE